MVNWEKRQKIPVARRYASHHHPNPVTPAQAGIQVADGFTPPKLRHNSLITDALPGPLKGAEQRRGVGGLRLALSEPQASLASRPAHRVAQGTGAAGTDPGVAFFLATFSWRSKKKYARPQGGTPSLFTDPHPSAQQPFQPLPDKESPQHLPDNKTPTHPVSQPPSVIINHPLMRLVILCSPEYSEIAAT